MRRIPRFKSEKVTQFVLLTGKLVTMIILTMLTYPLILFLAEIQISQETLFLYLGGVIIGCVSGKIKFRGEINKRMTVCILLLSGVTIMFIVNLLMFIGERVMITILGVILGIPTYVSIKYNFRDLEEEVKDYYHNERIFNRPF